MVVFTCNHCGDSLQKPRVAKHYQTTCSRNPIALTCVDCFKDFNLQEYAAHTSCLTEEDRYSAKGTAPKVLKGALKQTEWVNTVNTIIEQQKNAKPGVRNLLEALVDYNNLPRKKVKFLNFMRSTFNHKFTMRDTEAVWDLLEAHKVKEASQLKAREEKQKNDEAKQETQENGGNEENGENKETVENGKSKKKRKNKTNGIEEEAPTDKKQKLDETDETPSKKKKKKKTVVEETPETNGDTPSKTKTKKEKKTSENEINNSKLEESQNEKFSFKQLILEILTKKPKGLKKEALQNKVFKKYEAVMGPVDDENRESLLKKYNKKLKALKNVACDNDKYKISNE